ncbi:MAG: cupin domain-containing protein [Candidatus Thorarchaeota archaeon]|nr:cupin domain-containing protein [Candidatus Thorarchaeota archaeon]
MYVINHKEREQEEVTMDESEKTTVRWLIGRRSGAKTYAMRLFEIAPGGKIPLHQHDEEHEIFILQGTAKVLGASEDTYARKDDVVFIPSNEEHGYDNSDGSEPFQFICVIPLLKKD